MSSEDAYNVLFILNDKNKLITREYIESILKKYAVDHTVKNLGIFQRAMTHISYLDRELYPQKSKMKRANVQIKDIEPIENPEKAIQLQRHSYERLEYLGDSVIHCILADYLFNRYTDQDEGFMTKLRTKIENGKTLAELTRAIGLNEYILISRHIEENEGREKNMHILEDSFEAFMAALYLEGRFEICKKFMVALIEQEIDFAHILQTETNFKDILLQFFHKKKWQDPIYDGLDISGPDHKKLFTMYVKCKKRHNDDGEIVGTGTGTSKKKGEQEAARMALIEFGIIKGGDQESESETCESLSCETSDDDDEIIIESEIDI